jgi:hypothetical protein
MLPYILAAVGGYLIGDSMKGKQFADGGMMAEGGYMARGGKLEVGDTVMVDDSGYVKLFTGFDISKPAKIISKGKTKSNGKVVYFYGLETADGKKPFNNAPEWKLSKVSSDGGMMAKGGITKSKEEYPELRKIADKIADDTAERINKEVKDAL